MVAATLQGKLRLPLQLQLCHLRRARQLRVHVQLLHHLGLTVLPRDAQLPDALLASCVRDELTTELWLLTVGIRGSSG